MSTPKYLQSLLPKQQSQGPKFAFRMFPCDGVPLLRCSTTVHNDFLGQLDGAGADWCTAEPRLHLHFYNINPVKRAAIPFFHTLKVD